jgi:hypothetical protein
MMRKFQFESDTPAETLDDLIYYTSHCEKMDDHIMCLIYAVLKELFIIDHPYAKERYDHWQNVRKILEYEIKHLK